MGAHKTKKICLSKKNFPECNWGLRKEVRKIKKSEGTGKGSGDIYIPKWSHFKDCSVVEDVIASDQPTLLNAVPLAVQPTLPPHCDECGSNNDAFDLGDDEQQPKK